MDALASLVEAAASAPEMVEDMSDDEEGPSTNRKDEKKRRSNHTAYQKSIMTSCAQKHPRARIRPGEAFGARAGAWEGHPAHGLARPNRLLALPE